MVSGQNGINLSECMWFGCGKPDYVVSQVYHRMPGYVLAFLHLRQPSYKTNSILADYCSRRVIMVPNKCVGIAILLCSQI